jgi:E3 SUMO-protein ligase PIAS1
MASTNDRTEPAKAEVDSLIRIVQIPSVSKAILQSICAVNGLSKYGNKADLQKRIINRK